MITWAVFVFVIFMVALAADQIINPKG